MDLGLSALGPLFRGLELGPGHFDALARPGYLSGRFTSLGLTYGGAGFGLLSF